MIIVVCGPTKTTSIDTPAGVAKSSAVIPTPSAEARKDTVIALVCKAFRCFRRRILIGLHGVTVAGDRIDDLDDLQDIRGAEIIEMWGPHGKCSSSGAAGVFENSSQYWRAGGRRRPR